MTVDVPTLRWAAPSPQAPAAPQGEGATSAAAPAAAAEPPAPDAPTAQAPACAACLAPLLRAPSADEDKASDDLARMRRMACFVLALVLCWTATRAAAAAGFPADGLGPWRAGDLAGAPRPRHSARARSLAVRRERRRRALLFAAVV